MYSWDEPHTSHHKRGPTGYPVNSCAVRSTCRALRVCLPPPHQQPLYDGRAKQSPTHFTRRARSGVCESQLVSPRYSSTVRPSTPRPYTRPSGLWRVAHVTSVSAPQHHRSRLLIGSPSQTEQRHILCLLSICCINILHASCTINYAVSCMRTGPRSGTCMGSALVAARVDPEYVRWTAGTLTGQTGGVRQPPPPPPPPRAEMLTRASEDL